MKDVILKTFVSAVSVVFIMLIAGCEEQNLSNTQSSVKKHRFIAMENRELKENLEKSNEEIEKLKKLLAKRKEEKKFLEQQTEGRIQKEMDSMVDAVMEENAKLRKENEALKSLVEKLRKELAKLRTRPTIPKQPQPL